MYSPLGIILLIVAGYLVVKSPRKLHTFGRMGIAFVVVTLVIILGNAILRIGDPRGWGHIATLLGLIAAVFVGERERQSLARAKKGAGGHGE